MNAAPMPTSPRGSRETPRAPPGRGRESARRGWALREELDGVGADLDGAVDGALDAASAVGRRSAPCVTLLPCPSASAWPRARPASSTSGNVRTALFNWLFARHEGGEFRLRIENTDTEREVAEAAEQIQRLAALARARLGRRGDVPARPARALPGGGRTGWSTRARRTWTTAPFRFRMPDEGVTAWDDLVLGPIEFPNETIEDLVILRSDGRPTYNFASPLEDVWDEITHVIRGHDHISNTPKQINVLRALGAELPVYAHVPNVYGADGSEALQAARRDQASTSCARDGYLARALLNFLALLGWSYDDKTTIMSRDELVERFSLERVSKSPAVFDYEKLDWMNGVYLRALSPDAVRRRAARWLRTRLRLGRGLVSPRRCRSSRRRSRCFSEFPAVRRLPLRAGGARRRRARRAAPSCSRPRLRRSWRSSRSVEAIELALRGLAESHGLKPRDAFQPIRLAVTGSKVSPGLFESIELLGRDESAARLSAIA